MDQVHIIQNFCKENIQKLNVYTTDINEIIEDYETPLLISEINDIFFCNISRNYKIIIYNKSENSTKKQSIDKQSILKKKIIEFRVFCKDLSELTFEDQNQFLLQFIKSENIEKKQPLFSDDTTLNIHSYKLIYRMKHQPLCMYCCEPICNKAVKYKCKHSYYQYLHFTCKRLHDDDRFVYNYYITPKVCNCNHTARIIQRQFKKSISVPNYTLCKNRLKREFNELSTTN